jgi:hypothetical protein
MPVPPVIVWAVGAIGAAVVGRLITKEWRRVNADLDRMRTASVSEPEAATLPKLTRDPATGVYRPSRRPPAFRPGRS